MKHSFHASFRICLSLLLTGAITLQMSLAQSRTYTTDADFDEGILTNLNHNIPNQLQLNSGTAAFPFVNVSASQRGTAVKIHTVTGLSVGEYFTAPDGMGRNPSRTTVDQLGNVWVGNRDEWGQLVNKGSLTRIGLIVGGTRTDASGNPDMNGQYLEGPFDYNTCQDRHGVAPGTAPDGLIKTSRGLGNILPWTNTGGANSLGGVTTADDECIINYTRAGSPNTRTIAIDKNNDVFVGGTGNLEHEKVDGVTGQPVPGTTFQFSCGGYGGFIDGNGVLWSMTSGGSYLRFDTNTMTGACRNLSNYGTGVDPNTGEIWITTLTEGLVHKVAADGTFIASYAHGSPYAQGVVVDNDGNVWVAHSLFSETTVGHLKTDGTFIGNVLLPGGNGPTGVAVDAAGKVWVANINTNNAMRIDPDAGSVGADGVTPVGAVDLTVDLGPGAGPYNYSDMTGSVVASVTAPQGTWTVIYDGGAAGVDWSMVTWSGSEPSGTSITVNVRSSNSEAGLAGETYVPVTNGGTLAGISGRYIQIETTLARGPSSVESPILFELGVSAAQQGDATAAVCGPIVVENNANRQLIAVNSSTMDPESGIASIKFTKLVNLNGFLNGAGPFVQGYTQNYDPDTTSMVEIRGERINMAKGGSLLVLVTNGAGLTSVCDPVLETVQAEIPVASGLESNYPNPFSSETTIRISLAEASHVLLRIYDISGREVRTLVNEEAQAGTHEVVWDGRDGAGFEAPSGTYLYRVVTEHFTESKTMTLIK